MVLVALIPHHLLAASHFLDTRHFAVNASPLCEVRCPACGELQGRTKSTLVADLVGVGQSRARESMRVHPVTRHPMIAGGRVIASAPAALRPRAPATLGARAGDRTLWHGGVWDHAGNFFHEAGPLHTRRY